MSNKRPRLAVFPGVFDPITLGHLDIIRRAAPLFDELVIAVGDNPQKVPLLPQRRRVQIARRAVAAISGVRVVPYAGLTVDLARRLGADVILRGIRSSSDLHAELQMAAANRAIAGVETLFLMTCPRYAFISSSLIKQIAGMGGDVSAFVPPIVVARLKAKFAAKAAR